MARYDYYKSNATYKYVFNYFYKYVSILISIFNYYKISVNKLSLNSFKHCIKKKTFKHPMSAKGERGGGDQGMEEKRRVFN